MSVPEPPEERRLCERCGGNGTIPVRNADTGQCIGVAVCPECNGNCWHDAPPQPAPSDIITNQQLDTAAMAINPPFVQPATINMAVVEAGDPRHGGYGHICSETCDVWQPACSECGNTLWSKCPQHADEATSPDDDLPGCQQFAEPNPAFEQPSVQPAPAGFSTFEEAISRLKAIMSAAIYTTAEQRQVPDGMFIEIRAAHAKEVEEWKRALLDIAAVLHHDGGHWMTREMTAKEVHDACVEAWSADVMSLASRAGDGREK